MHCRRHGSPTRSLLAALVLPAALAFGLPLANPDPIAAQVIRGVVLDGATGDPLDGVRLRLLDPGDDVAHETLSDRRGAFQLVPPAPGLYRIAADLIGYADIRSDTLNVAGNESVQVEVRMNLEAVPLEPVVVTGRSRHYDDEIHGFHSRMERGRRTGMGHFLSREDVDRLGAVTATDLLRAVPGVRVVPGRFGASQGLRMSGGCVPAIFIDGIQINRPPLTAVSLDDHVSTMSIEGVEVYRGAAAQVGRFHDSHGCGLVLIWTRRGTPSDEPLSWRRILFGLGLVTLILILR